MLKILLFASLREQAGESELKIEPPRGGRVRDVYAHLLQSFPGLPPDPDRVLAAVNECHVDDWDAAVSDGDEVAFFPPVSGGDSPMVGITRNAIEERAVVDSVVSDEAGALVTFSGRVRSRNQNRDVLFLEYEAYPAMAAREMEGVRAEALERWPVKEIAIFHRLGKLELGETSVFIAVASAHRSEAFEACRWIIDTLKKKVPIWKKEHFEKGAVWIEGPTAPDAQPE